MSATTRYAWQLLFAVHVLRQGGIVAHPTEAVWGLACDPFDEVAVHALLKLKNRPVSKGLILVSGQVEHFSPLLDPLNDVLRDRFQESQSHPITWLLPDDANQIPGWIKGEHRSVAVRVTKHPVIEALTSKLGQPIVSTSANPTGHAPAKTIFKIRHYFANSLSYVLPAPLGEFSHPSIIRDLKTGRIIRS